MQINTLDFKNFGVLTAKFSDNIMSLIIDDITNISKNRDSLDTHNQNLMGQLTNQYLLSDSINSLIEPELLALAKAYEVIYGKYTEYNNLSLGGAWVNFQKKYEYNPMHIHNGIYSFAAWITIPYTLNEELQLDNCKCSHTPVNSMFSFQYTDSLGRVNSHYIQVDKGFESTLVFFPAVLNHTVNPFFTSDLERISISGNLLSS